MVWFYLIVYGVAFGVLSSIAVKKRNRDPANWFLIGLFFGVFGLLAAVLVDKLENPVQQPKPSPPSDSQENFDPSLLTKKCPDCAETIKLEARVCRFCQHRFSEDEVQQQVGQLREGHEKQLEAKRKSIEAEKAARLKLMETHWECPWCHHLNPLASRRSSSCTG
jgi:hypothetical protein